MNEVEQSTSNALSYSIDIVNLNKRFKRKSIGRGGYTTLKSAFKSALQGILHSNQEGSSEVNAYFTSAVKDLTIRIPKGSSLGIIGRNGSGKSSLLKLITGIYKPDSGTVNLNGRLAALIELGAGFHPDFSGRENVYLGGIMYGLSKKQVAERFDQIVHFAELEHVIDDPVRTYSSGMFMRLGFSLAIHTDPDILLVDEVLAVGDAAFTSKCREHLATMRKAGKTLLLVSHDLDAVERWCDEVVWLDGGVARERGEPRRVIDAYRTFIERGEEDEILAENAHHKATDAQVAATPEVSPDEVMRWGSREVEITATRILDSSGGAQKALFHPQDGLTIEMQYRLNDPTASKELVFGIALTRTDGVLVHGTNTDIERILLPKLSTTGALCYHIQRLGLLDGSYSVDVAVHREDGYPFDYQKNACRFSVRWHEKQQGVVMPVHSWSMNGQELTEPRMLAGKGAVASSHRTEIFKSEVL